jgi:uncharacterized protein (DUF952 family)
MLATLQILPTLPLSVAASDTKFLQAEVDKRHTYIHFAVGQQSLVGLAAVFVESDTAQNLNIVN